MSAVRTPFFSFLDDDDELFADHFTYAMNVFQKHAEADLVYSGGIIHEEEDYNLQKLAPRLAKAGGGFYPERRHLIFLEPHDVRSLTKGDNVILSHSFVARSKLLTKETLKDPRLAVSEDMYLYLLWIAQGARFFQTGRASVIWNWRSVSRENSMLAFNDKDREHNFNLINARLRDFLFPGLGFGKDVIGKSDCWIAAMKFVQASKSKAKRIARVIASLLKQ